MKRVVPVWETSGFSLAWKWPHLAVGGPNGSAIFLPTGAKVAEAPSWMSGWYDGATLLVRNDTPGGQRLTLLSTAGPALPLDITPNWVIGAVGSGDGRWVSNVAGIIREAGTIIDNNPANLGIWATGPYTMHSRIEGPQNEPEWQRWRSRVYFRGSLQRVAKHGIPAHQRYLTPYGDFTYSDMAHARVNWASGQDDDLSVTTNGMDFCPKLVTDLSNNLWQWSPVGAKATNMIVRRMADTSRGYVLELPFGLSAFDVCHRPDGWWLAWANSSGQVGVATVLLDFEPIALPTLWPPQTPPPVEPPTPPVEPPIMEHLDTVKTERAKYGTPLGLENAWKVSNATALTHRAEGWGLLAKPSGSNWQGYSVDVIVNKVTRQAVDILGDSEGAGNPQWGVIAWDESFIDRWREPVGAVTPPPEPPIEPPDDTLESRVAYLEEVTSHILKHLREI